MPLICQKMLWKLFTELTHETRSNLALICFEVLYKIVKVFLKISSMKTLFPFFRVFRILPHLQLLDGIPRLDSDDADAVVDSKTCIVS